MKKLVITALVLISFLLGNVSMLAGIVKVFGIDALKPVLNNLIFERVYRILYGELPARRPVDIKTSYSNIQGTRPRRSGTGE